MSNNNINNHQAVGLLLCGIGVILAILAYTLNLPMYLSLGGDIAFLIGLFYFIKYRNQKTSSDTSERMK